MSAKRLKELRQRLYAGIPADAKALREKAEAESRDLNESEVERINALAEEKTRVSAEIGRLEQLETLEAPPPPHAPAMLATPTPNIPAGRIEYVRDNAAEDPRSGFAHFGDFAASVMGAMTPGNLADPRLDVHAAATGLSQGIPADGGYLIPPTFAQQIFDRFQRQSDNLLSRCDQYTVEGESLSMPAVDETSRAAGSRWGGIRGYWISEAAQITSSKPKFRQVKLEPKELAVLCYATDKSLRNSPVALEAWLSRAAGDEIAFCIGDAIVNGTGAGQPLGILASGAAVSVAKESGQLAATLMAENIGKMWARRHPQARNLVWLYNQDVEPQLDQLQIGTGAANQIVYMPPGGLSASPFGTLKGREMVPCEFCATLGTVGDIILADLSAYAIGLRGYGLQAAMSMHLRFDYAETAFRFIFEVDGQPWIKSPLTPYKGTSNTVSPFVTLATRA